MPKNVCPSCGAVFYTAEPATKCVACGAPIVKKTLTIEEISEKITQLLNEINLQFTPKTKEEDEVMRKVRQQLVEAGALITKHLEKR
jgi:hypothetical protein